METRQQETESLISGAVTGLLLLHQIQEPAKDICNPGGHYWKYYPGALSS